MPKSVELKTSPVNRDRLAGDVAYYLSLRPRQLPSRYLYDDLGSALFDAICHLPWYQIARLEHQLLTLHAAEIFAHLGSLKTIIELGSGNGEKLARLLAAHPRGAMTVHLVDVSPTALTAAIRALTGRIGLTLVAHCATYEAGLVEALRGAQGGGRSLVLFLGSNIGNFDPPNADAFLHGIRAALNHGDALLLGADLVKPERELLLAYDDPLGVTAAFNKNLLVRANRELEADFDLDGFAHRAVWNSEASRIEMHLVSLRRQRVRVPAAHLEIAFESGETIWTESSYKYQPDDVVAMLGRAGFSTLSQWTADGFGLTLAAVA
jgi:dimethylhistidine N-methyltransferase